MIAGVICARTLVIAHFRGVDAFIVHDGIICARVIVVTWFIVVGDAKSLIGKGPDLLIEAGAAIHICTPFGDYFYVQCALADPISQVVVDSLVVNAFLDEETV